MYVQEQDSVRICKIEQIPEREPKFHHGKIVNGAGISTHIVDNLD